MTASKAKKPKVDKAKNEERRAKLGDSLAAKLDALRGAADDMAEAYRLRIQAGLAELSSVARAEARLDETPARLRPAVAEKMLDRIQDVGLKPNKGRGKDFQRLEDLIDELSRLVPREK